MRICVLRIPYPSLPDFRSKNCVEKPKKNGIEEGRASLETESESETELLG